jgi:hypothetical protein
LKIETHPSVSPLRVRYSKYILFKQVGRLIDKKKNENQDPINSRAQNKSCCCPLTIINGAGSVDAHPPLGED